MYFNDKIELIAKEYFKEQDKTDFSHDFNHVRRVTNLAIHIGEIEGADLETLTAAAWLHDIQRGAEDSGKVTDHSKAAASLAPDILRGVRFPEEKIEAVCHAISVHRSGEQDKPLTIEAAILQDADRLDALGAIDIARVIGSKLQSQKYAGPIYIDEAYQGEQDVDKSAIHYLIYKSQHPKRKPENFNTATGKKIATERFNFNLEYINRFIKEWHGDL